MTCVGLGLRLPDPSWVHPPTLTRGQCQAIFADFFRSTAPLETIRTVRVVYAVALRHADRLNRWVAARLLVGGLAHAVVWPRRADIWREAAVRARAGIGASGMT